MTIRLRVPVAFVAAMLVLGLSGPVFAQRLPDYYPETFQRTGTVDDIRNDRIVVNDIPYVVSGDVVVHTLTERESFLSYIRRGTKIGYRVGQNRQIVEVWQLPGNYEEPSRR